MSQRTCIMGCAWKRGEARHSFPKDPKRRAEWCRILGIYPRAKKVFICGDHFINGYFFGNRLSMYAKPNPPESRILNFNKLNINYESDINSILAESINNNSNSSKDPIQYENLDTNSISAEDISTSCIEDNNSLVEFSKETERTQESEILEGNIENNSETTNKIPFLTDTINNQSCTVVNAGKIEDFEIRKGTTKDTIIKGRYVQTNDYLVVSYTPPRKWTLQQQVEKLDVHCKNQLNQIKNLNRENSRLRKENKLYEKVLPKLRYLHTKNRILMSALKIYKEKEVKRRKVRKIRRKLKMVNNSVKQDLEKEEE